MHKLALSLAFLACSVAAHAAPIYTTSITVPYTAGAPESNFSSPDFASDTTTYTIKTGFDLTNFYVDVSAPSPETDISGLQFANIYIGGPNFSGLIIEATNSLAYNLNPGGSYKSGGFSLAGTGYSFTQSTNDISFALPWSYLETDPSNMGFSKANVGDIIRISYSQSFGYSFVGGSGGAGFPIGYNSVTRLGSQIVPTAIVPEPGSFLLGGLGLLGLGVLVYRRRQLAA